MLELNQPWDAHQHAPARQDQNTDCEQQVADLDRSAVAPMAGSQHVQNAKNQKRNKQRQSEYEMQAEHVHVEHILVTFATQVSQRGNARQVERIGSQYGDQREDDVQQLLQPRTYRPTVLARRCS